MSAPQRPTFGKMKPKRALGARDAHVARERDDRAGADRDAVDRGDDRATHPADVPDERAGHAGELEEALHVPREELGDDRLAIAAGAEAACPRR